MTGWGEVVVKCQSILMATPWDKTWQLLPYRQISAHYHPTFLSLTQRHTQSKGGVDLTHKQTSTKPVSPPQSGIPVKLETHRQSNYTSFTQTPTIVASTNSLGLCYPLIWFQAHIQHGTNLQLFKLSEYHIGSSWKRYRNTCLLLLLWNPLISGIHQSFHK